MVANVEKPSKEHAFLRVDLYFFNGPIYFGELTFFPNSDFGKFTPQKCGEKLGLLLTLPNEMRLECNNIFIQKEFRLCA